jgi:hypothetical protein
VYREDKMAVSFFMATCNPGKPALILWFAPPKMKKSQPCSCWGCRVDFALLPWWIKWMMQHRSAGGWICYRYVQKSFWRSTRSRQYCLWAMDERLEFYLFSAGCLYKRIEATKSSLWTQ